MPYFSKRIFRLGIIFVSVILVFLSQKNAPSSIVLEQSAPIVAEKQQEAIPLGQKEKTENYYFVARVIDGDTIVVEMNGEPVKVRLIGLDTPETVDPRRPVQCFGKEASEKAKNILTGQKVRIETDPSQGSRDKYHRLLAYIFLPDGTLFNKMMIEEGYGHEYTYRLPYRYQTEFKNAETKARESKKGLWAEGVCI